MNKYWYNWDWNYWPVTDGFGLIGTWINRDLNHPPDGKYRSKRQTHPQGFKRSADLKLRKSVRERHSLSR